MNRSDFQQLAQIRLAEAQALLAAGLPAGAYYLAGYVIECALKACIAKGVQQYDFPDKDRVLKSYSHDYVQLAQAAGLEKTFLVARQQNSVLNASWEVVKDWSESSRYNPVITMVTAQSMVAAVSDPVNGVFTWLTHQW